MLHYTFRTDTSFRYTGRSNRYEVLWNSSVGYMRCAQSVLQTVDCGRWDIPADLTQRLKQHQLLLKRLVCAAVSHHSCSREPLFDNSPHLSILSLTPHSAAHNIKRKPICPFASVIAINMTACVSLNTSDNTRLCCRVNRSKPISGAPSHGSRQPVEAFCIIHLEPVKWLLCHIATLL